MGEATFFAVPPLVDREGEMGRIRKALEATGTTEAPLLLIRGEAGAGKTRLIQEVAAEAARQGRAVAIGYARAGSTAPYHLWTDLLDALGLGHVLKEAPPPRLLGLYVITRDGLQLVKVERNANGESRSPVDELAVVPDPGESGGESLLGGGLSAHGRGERRVLVLERPDFRICAVVEGHEDERFLADLRASGDAVPPGPESGQAIEQTFRELLDSGKYEGIDYGKGDPKLRQSRLFQNTASGLTRQAELRPLVLVFDDLQWADPSSLALLQYVARNLRNSHAHLLGTYRVEEGNVRAHLRDALHQMEKEALVAEIDLGGLSRRDLGLLAESFIGPNELSGPFLDLLWQETQGNPLIVREVLRGLEEEGAIKRHGAAKRLVLALGDLSIPHRVREAVRARLDRVPREDRRLLEAAAACGTRFTTAMVARLIGETEGRVLNGFGTIAGVHGFLREGETGFAFDHPALQEVLYEDMAEDIRRVYHREAAEWLELAGGPLEDMAEHLYRARDPRAVGRLRQAAQRARKRYANEEAVRFNTEALDLEEDGERRRELLEEIGAVCTLTGAYEKALDCYESARELADNGENRAEILVEIGRIHFLRGAMDECIGESTEARRLAGGKANYPEARALTNIGNAHWQRGDYDAALACFKMSLQVFEGIGDEPGISRLLNNIGNVYSDRAEHKAAVEYYARSLKIKEKLGDWPGIGRLLGNIGSVYTQMGDYDSALDHHRRSLEVLQKVGDRPGVSISLNNIACVYSDRGDLDAALECYRKSLEIKEEIGDASGIAIVLGNIGDINLERGECATALQCHERSLSILREIDDKYSIAVCLKNIGNVHARQGDYDVALEHLRKSLELWESLGGGGLSADTYCGLAEVKICQGDLKEAWDFCNNALSMSTENSQIVNVAVSKRIFGIIYRERRMWQASIENFEKSIQILEEIGRPLEHAKSHYEFGLMWKQAGEFAKARDQFAAASGIFETLKLDKDLQKVVQASRGLE